jgi:hypothetical protein
MTADINLSSRSFGIGGEVNVTTLFIFIISYSPTSRCEYYKEKDILLTGYPIAGF